MPAAFTELGLAAQLTQALDDLGFEEPTPIQIRAIPPLLSGRDVLGRAATGTGKTAAFALPLLQRHALGRAPGAPVLLILTPTRELCRQVAENCQAFGSRARLKTAAIYGGDDYLRQVRALRSGAHAVVATPGRALDLAERGELDLGQVRALVLDEADEMLDMGFADELEAILGRLPAERQTALFSATLPASILEIASSKLSSPENVVVEQTEAITGAAPQVAQSAYCVRKAQRLAALARILRIEAPELALVFTRTRLEVEEVSEGLRARGLAVESLHGGLDQASRERVIARARNGSAAVIVATDVAARGLDIDRISHVFNYGVPESAQTYVHRIGRTGRAGRSGVAITILEPYARRQLRELQAAAHADIACLEVPTAAEARGKLLDNLCAQIARKAGDGAADASASACLKAVDALVGQGADPKALAVAALRVMLAAHNAAGDDEEIASAGSFERRERRAGPAEGGRERSGAPCGGPPRIFISIGREAGVTPKTLVGAITGEAGVNGSQVGPIEIRDRFSLVGLEPGIVSQVVKALKKATIRGRKVTVRRDDPERAGAHGEKAGRRDRAGRGEAPASRFADEAPGPEGDSQA
ncbi:MAG: DEAD/DEAH box helicase [Duodenibacillus sp.]|nr:DEAD/DEAH box helicase [Duodenibacillus sp.]